MTAIIDAEIVSASNRAESSLTAPAWIISLTRQDLLDRGYVELTELLDDLPSMDIIRSFGLNYVKSYWRGYRSANGSPFLLMVDGVILNSLWDNDITVMGVIPLSLIDHVEVVYGPASAVYGPNAAMGVINVITNRSGQERGLHTDVRLTLASPHSTRLRNQTKIADTSVRYRGEDYRVIGSARFEFGVLDPTIATNFEWTKNKYYRSPHWGRFGRLHGVGEGFRSPDEKQGAALRLLFGEHAACGDRNVKPGQGSCAELAVEHYQQTTGHGTEQPAPIVQTRPGWTYVEQNAYIRYVRDLTHVLYTDSRLRFRVSSIDKSSQRLVYDYLEADDGTGVQLVAGSRLGTAGSAWVLTQDFGLDAGQNLLTPGDQLTLNFGGKYSRINIDHDLIHSDLFATLNGKRLSPSELESLDLRAAPRAVDSTSYIDAGGLYLLGFYSLFAKHHLSAGLRLDYAQHIGEMLLTVRAGYVGRFSKALTLKVLYGQAVQEPTMNELLSVSEDPSEDTVATSTSGQHCVADCARGKLSAERSQTLEVSLNWTTEQLALRVGGYWVNYHNALVTDSLNYVTNADTRNVLGTDLSAHALVPLWNKAQLALWAYYSTLFKAKQTDVDSADGSLVPIGDLAQHKVLGGCTLRLTEDVAVTALGRLIGTRDTVQSNPLEMVDAYGTLDANLRISNLLFRGLALALRVTNLLDTTYYHPGLLDASSGDDPSTFTADYQWTGGEYNSLLPQPGREVYITLGISQ